MLADRTEAIEKECRDAGRVRHSSVARLVLGGAPALGEAARSGDELTRRITRLASMAAVLHLGQTASQRARSGASQSTGADGREVTQ